MINLQQVQANAALQEDWNQQLAENEAEAQIEMDALEQQSQVSQIQQN